MADHELTLTALTVQLSSSGEGEDREMAAVVSFTANAETWQITIPDVLHDDIRHLLRQFDRATSRDQYIAGLAESEDFTTVLL